MDKLTPNLTDEQIRQNIDALRAQNVATATIQSYVNNYTRSADGGYILKNAPAPVAAATPKKDNIGTKVVKAVTSSERAFGKDIAGAIMEKTPGVAAAQKGAMDAASQEAAVFSKVVAKYHELAAQGKDNSALGQIIEEHAKAQGIPVSDILPEAAKKTKEQIVGDAGGVLLDAASAGTLPGAATAAVDAGKTTGIVKGAIAGAKAGAKAAIPLGAAYGADQALKENKSAGGVVVDALKGGAAGAVTGGVLGAVTGGISGGIASHAEKVKEKAAQTALDAITPNTKDLTPKEYGELLSKGRVLPKSGTDPAKYILSQKEKDLAGKFEHILQSGDPVQNINSAATEIVNKDHEVGQFLRTQTTPYVKEDLRKSISSKLSGVQDVMVDSKQLSSAKKKMLETIMNKLPNSNSGRSYENLWEFRKNLDQTLETQLNAFSGNPTLKKEMSKAIRNGIQDFIKSNTKDTVYANKMLDMTQLYDLIDMLKTTAVKEKGMSALKVWMNANPTKSTAIKFIIGAGLADAGLKATGH